MEQCLQVILNKIETMSQQRFKQLNEFYAFGLWSLLSNYFNQIFIKYRYLFFLIYLVETLQILLEENIRHF